MFKIKMKREVEKMSRYYMAYGSNLNMRQMGYRCPDAKAVGTMELEGFRLAFKGSRTGSYLTIDEQEGYSVPIGLWSVSERDERNLDRYEGYPTFYRKEEVDLGGGDVGFIYIMNGCKYGMPTKMYVETCIEGYADFGFDFNVLLDAIHDTAKEVKGVAV